MNYQVFIVVFLSFFISFGDSANVLIIFSVPSKSHTILGHALGRGLIKNGHNVTMLSPYPQDKNLPNYHDLKLTKVMDTWTLFLNGTSRLTVVPNYQLLFRLFENVANLAEATIQDDNFQRLMNKDHKFDVVIISSLFNEALFAVGHYFNAPVIPFATTGPSGIINYLVGNPNPYAYVPDIFLSFSDRMTFSQRLINTGFGVLINTLKFFLHRSGQEKVLKKYFPNAPNINELQKLVAIVLTNSHRALDYPRPLVPNIIEVGGLQVAKPNKLPNDLQEFMDNATEGVIYFSLGTNIRNVDIPNETRDSFVEVFSKLKQKVLWKWDDPSIPGLSKNVRLNKWYPQGDLLAHPNLKLFITHGGLLSTTETLVRGVPCIGIPIFGDQQRNMQTAETKGFAITLKFTNITTESLSWTLNEALTNPKYSHQAKKLSLLLNDNIVHPMDKAVYWVEYVIRHKGAPHLMSAAVDIPLYQYLLLDVIGFILLILFVIFTISYLIIKKIIIFLKKKYVQQKDKND